MRATPLPAWKTYLRWKLLNDAAPSLSKAFVEADFDFYGKVLQGTPENEVRWKRCVVATDGSLGQALGKSYVRDYFPPEAKAAADKMVKNLVAALREDLKTLPWMGDATRKKALEKLAAFRPKIGYPDVWRDYSSLTIDRGPYVRNVQRAAEFEFRRQLAKVGRPVDREDWQMTPPEVNAYYDAQLNEIVFPAGILQPPFFDPKADDAVNYGAMGAVIGHELTHGFDDEGRKFDARGNMSDWWTAEDAKNYEARAKCVESQFAAYTFEGQNVNGKLVLGESIADLGGLSIAHRAYRGTLAGKPEPAPIDGLSARPAFLPRMGPCLVGERAARALEAPDEHQPASAARVPRQRGAVEPALVRGGVFVQGGGPDGARGPVSDLVTRADRADDSAPGLTPTPRRSRRHRGASDSKKEVPR